MRYATITDRLAGLGSDKWEIHHRARQMARDGVPVLELTIGEPDIPPDSDLAEVMMQALAAGRVGYSNGRGEPGLLAALAARYSRRTGREMTPANFLCFPGTQTALYAVITALAETGDAVLVPDPFYATYEGVIRSTGARMQPVALSPTNGFHLTPEALEAAITPDCRVLLLNNPHNPTGAVLSRDEIAAIGAVCARHDIWIVSDEVYEELIYDGGAAEFASPLDMPDLADRTVAVSSISKSHAAPGFRSGWCAGPAEFCARLLPVAETMLFGNPPFIADATAHALTRPTDVAARMRGSYKRRADTLAARLTGNTGLTCLMPQAGMFMVVDVSGTGLSGDTFARRLLDEARVAVMPGSSFGAEADGFIRISLTTPDEKLAEAADRIADFAAALATARSQTA